MIEGLASLGRAVVVARAGHRVGLPRRERLWVADFLPGEAIAAKACAVVCNGGSPTSQQALVHGVPVIGIASNLDQYLNMDYVERFGAGTLMRADRVSATAVRDAAERAIADEEMRCRARAAAAMARATRPEVQFVSAIQLLLDEAPPLDDLVRVVGDRSVVAFRAAGHEARRDEEEEEGPDGHASGAAISMPGLH